jgi:tetratricopeptide (TPR) repeat protein
MGIFDKFKRNYTRKYEGLIKAFGLIDFWNTLSDEERVFIKECYSKGLSLGGKRNPEEIDSPNIKFGDDSQSAPNFLNAMAKWAIQYKKYELAEKLAKEAEKRAKPQNESVKVFSPVKPHTREYIDLHFSYNRYIEMYYKQRDKGEYYLNKCIEYCKRDLKILPFFLGEWLKEFGQPLPRILAIDRLRIIYEKQEKYQDATNICKLALKYGLEDNTKEGYKGHIERLNKKMSKEKKGE